MTAALRDAVTLYLAVDQALPRVDPAKLIPSHLLASHQCDGRRCDFVNVGEKLFSCLYSGHLHHCTADTCDRLEETPEGLICQITGFGFESRPLLVASDFAAFGGQQARTQQQQQQESHTRFMNSACGTGSNTGANESSGGGGGDDDDDIIAPSSEEDDVKMTMKDEVEVSLEEAKDNPFDSQREREFARTQREHAERRRECDKLLELLLFSEHRKALNEWADEHTRLKHLKGVANYMRNVKRVVYENVWRIISLDRNETAWCVSMPIRDSRAHLDCVRVCEQACVWWNRFVADNQGKPLPNYTFKYHVLAVLYIYAVGMISTQGRELLAASPILRATLPGVETLKDFPGMLPGYYTNHERTCRERILAWIAKRA